MNPSPGEDPGVGVVREPRASDFPRFPVCAVRIVTHTNDPTLQFWPRNFDFTLNTFVEVGITVSLHFPKGTL